MSAGPLTRLFEPIKIGSLTLKNRIILPPMVTNFGSEDGFVSERIKDYYAERAKGGAALLTLENGIIAPNGRLTPYAIAAYDDKFIPGLTELAKIIHENGAKASIQVHHAGPRADIPAELDMIGVSPVAVVGRVPRELKASEVPDIAAKYAKAVQRLIKAGFDAIEVQFGGGYLAGSFMSRVTNHRQDEYNGDVKARSRIHREILKAIRDLNGPDFPVVCRMNMLEYGEKNGITGGLTLEESKEFAHILEEAGASALSMLLYGFQKARWGIAQDNFPLFPDVPGVYLSYAQQIKKVVKIPIISAGRVSPLMAEKAIQEGQIDIAAIGRQLIADPETPNKAAAGRLGDIRTCIGCYRCVGKVFENKPLECTVNAAAGKERDFPLVSAAQKKRVFVIGAGPGGMEAARVSALRGHEVTLFDEEHQVGGLLPLAALIKQPELEDLEALLRYFKQQLKGAGVQLKLGHRVSSEINSPVKPDVVIVATGAKTSLPQLPGIDSRNVSSPASIKSQAKFFMRWFGPGLLRWLTGFYMPMGKRVVILGGNLIGLELAEFLARRGKKVTVLEGGKRLGTDMNMVARVRMLRWLGEQGVTTMTEVKVERITDKGVSLTTQSGEKKTIEADSVIPASFLAENHELFKALEGKFGAVYMVGDCSTPELLQHAIADGARVGRLI